MYQLNDQQIDCIADRLHRERRINRKLGEDLLDHFCCYMEERMNQGIDFEQAYSDAVKDITPNGVQEIEFELFFLLQYNKQLSMKKFIFITGFFAAFLLSAGLMFKTLHWTGAQIMLVTGLFTLLLTACITLFYLMSFSKKRPFSFWLRTLSGLLAVLLIATGLIFKSFHFPGANVLYGLGTIILNIIFLPAFFFHTYRFGFVKNQ